MSNMKFFLENLYFKATMPLWHIKRWLRRKFIKPVAFDLKSKLSFNKLVKALTVAH